LFGFVSNLTAVALLGHVLLGCCWHHQGCHAEEPSEEEHGSHDDCESGRCVFATTQPLRIAPVSVVLLRDAAAAVETDQAVLLVESNPLGEAFTATGRYPPPPIYLANQTLLL